MVVAITPGPSNVILTATGAQAGVRRGLPSLLGVAIGVGLLMFTVAFGLGSLVLTSPILRHTVKWGGIGFLLWLSWRIATAGRHETAGERTYVGFWSAAAFQWVNPKLWLVCTSAAGTYLQTAAGPALQQSFDFGLLFLLAALTGCSVWLALGAASRRFVHTDRAVRVFNVTMGVLLAGSVLLFIW